MKFITAIMACYLIVLSVLPCRDRHAGAFNNKMEVSVSADNNNKHQANPYQSDACTPFCTCSCCPASAFFQPAAVFSFLKIENKVSYLIPDLAFVSHDDKSIWQPPQLS